MVTETSFFIIYTNIYSIQDFENNSVIEYIFTTYNLHIRSDVSEERLQIKCIQNIPFAN